MALSTYASAPPTYVPLTPDVSRPAAAICPCAAPRTAVLVQATGIAGLYACIAWLHTCPAYAGTQDVHPYLRTQDMHACARSSTACRTLRVRRGCWRAAMTCETYETLATLETFATLATFATFATPITHAQACNAHDTCLFPHSAWRLHAFALSVRQDVWLSQSYQRSTCYIGACVRHAFSYPFSLTSPTLRHVEAVLEPFHARPHLGKVHACQVGRRQPRIIARRRCGLVSVCALPQYTTKSCLNRPLRAASRDH